MSNSGISGAERLRTIVTRQIPPGRIVVIANREPYAHERNCDGTIVARRPASGLVTGIEPVLRASAGTWIAHGGGSADRECSDRAGRVAVPPGTRDYTLRRIWIEEDEYERYYSGFANEALWPLCHLAHTRPTFRWSDWTSYQNVNAIFARAAVEEIRGGGLLLVQDYHFALIPRMVRNEGPHVVTGLFWHIPWPNWEMIAICPWKETLLRGMLGADIVGFHTRRYCENFLETLSHHLDCRVDAEAMAVTVAGHRTLVRPYPISIEWPYPAASRKAGAALRRSLGIPDSVHVSIAVDRADYTKGILERIAAIELLLEENPSLTGQFVFVQVACPTRSGIRSYQALATGLNEAVERINARFGNSAWKPVVLRWGTFSPAEVAEFFAMAGSALVTPLQDGMNLVAKEYVASCEDGDGVLVLSAFAGAAEELAGALVVNPYDTRQVARAVLRAIRMPPAERLMRMRAMREQIAGHTIYDWSESLLTDMIDIRNGREAVRGAAERVRSPVRERFGAVRAERIV